MIGYLMIVMQTNYRVDHNSALDQAGLMAYPVNVFDMECFKLALELLSLFAQLSHFRVFGFPCILNLFH